MPKKQTPHRYAHSFNPESRKHKEKYIDQVKRRQRVVDWVTGELKDDQVAYIDKRDGQDGYLWVPAGNTPVMQEYFAKFKAQGADFRFASDGSKYTDHKPAWYLKGSPRRKFPNAH